MARQRQFRQTVLAWAGARDAGRQGGGSCGAVGFGAPAAIPTDGIGLGRGKRRRPPGRRVLWRCRIWRASGNSDRRYWLGPGQETPAARAAGLVALSDLARQRQFRQTVLAWAGARDAGRQGGGSCGAVGFGAPAAIPTDGIGLGRGKRRRPPGRRVLWRCRIWRASGNSDRRYWLGPGQETPAARAAGLVALSDLARQRQFRQTVLAWAGARDAGRQGGGSCGAVGFGAPAASATESEGGLGWRNAAPGREAGFVALASERPGCTQNIKTEVKNNSQSWIFSV